MWTRSTRAPGKSRRITLTWQRWNSHTRAATHRSWSRGASSSRTRALSSACTRGARAFASRCTTIISPSHSPLSLHRLPVRVSSFVSRCGVCSRLAARSCACASPGLSRRCVALSSLRARTPCSHLPVRLPVSTPCSAPTPTPASALMATPTPMQKTIAVACRLCRRLSLPVSECLRLRRRHRRRSLHRPRSQPQLAASQPAAAHCLLSGSSRCSLQWACLPMLLPRCASAA
mmetsp:Transcript_23595/g.54656  ORF Transcript_23595/g.54656 Transcript_23595/m.54656 type:complete len:232 (+) Transcript_23595:1094-1789(+)